ncbi:MAG: putative DNA binding domain-containing protein [Bacteroidales bacterium]|nr:putative DNA binding domain-containing protein [Bacteroidales bacterium]
MASRYTIAQLRMMRESEDHVEFKKGEGGNVSYNGSGKEKPKDRRRCILGYIVALCNEGGGRLVIGMHDTYPHKVIGTQQNINAIGTLESNIYRDLGIRTDVYELYEDEESKKGRVLVIEVPPRPIGQLFKFEDVPLIRVGEDLLPMDESIYLSIIQEQEPDFSEQICESATIYDLDPEAIRIMKEQYARKQNNPSFLTISDTQALSDLHLVKDGKVTNAAVLLVGYESSINKLFPQAKVMLEYRNNDNQINFDSRVQFGQPFFILIDKLWETIDLRNGAIPIREGAYIFDIHFFNKDVVRELINNAFAHRDYRKASEIVIKQSSASLTVTNAGGFPNGVTLDNLLTTPSTPRNRLLADVLSKTGIVERSGQGIDKIFLYTLSEGKPLPDYTKSDRFSVTAILSAVVKDKAFAMFIQKIQQERDDEHKLSVFDIMALGYIRDGHKRLQDRQQEKCLEADGIIEKRGKTNATYYILSRNYYELAGDMASYSKATDWDINQVWAVLLPYLQKYGRAKRSDINSIIGNHLSDKQIRRFLEQLIGGGLLKTEGERGHRIYQIGDAFKENNELMRKALDIGLEALKKKGEI